MHFQFQDPQYIFQCASRLKYLNIQLINRRHVSRGETEKSCNKNIILMSTLRTLVLYFGYDSSITIDMLPQYFNFMPVLNRLEIKGGIQLLDANGWRMLLETSLLLLTHFCLRTTTSHEEEADVDNVLVAFQSPYWIEKKNFYIMITEHERWHFNGFGIHKMKHHVRDEFELPVLQCWIASNRSIGNDLIQ
ncbi:unnamed protein product, partial [Rotaria sp. Silwood2]